MAQDLFRKEVLEANRTSWLGGISLAQPVRTWVLSVAATVVAITVAAFLTLGTYTRRSRVMGQLVPSQGLATVLAPATGVVARVDVAEGTRVNAGQVLAVVSVPRATLADGDTKEALERRLQQRQHSLRAAQAAQQRLLAAQAGGLATQLAAAKRELIQIEAEIATRNEQVRLARESLARMRRLQRDKYVSDLQVEQQEAAALDQIGEMQILQRQAIGTRRLIAQLQQGMQEVPGQRMTAQANFQRDLALLEQEQVETEARGALAVSAPLSGVVAVQLAKPGQAVQAGQSLMTLLPGDGLLEAELLVPSRAIGFIEPGDRVLLRYQAYPYQKFGHQQGLVAKISRSALGPGDLGVPAAQSNEPFYRVTVAISRQAITAYGKAEPLKPGMLLEAEVLGERRRLIEWLFEPLYSIRGNVFES